MGLFLTILTIIFFLAVEVYFSGTEIALVVSDKMKLKAREGAGGKGAVAAMWFVRHPAYFFSTVILGTNISVIAATTAATLYLIYNYGEDAEIWAILLSPVVLIFGEVLPKSLFQHYSNRIIEKVAPALMASMYAMYPLVWILSRLTNVLLGGVQSHLGNEPRITREELALLISSTDSPDVKPSERKMVRKVLELAGQRAKNIMVPLGLIESVPVISTREAALRIFDLKGYSKLTVFEHRAYNIIGILDYIDCVFAHDAEVKELMRPVMYVPKEMKLHELYFRMKEDEQQTVIVVDEYGSAVGLITLEDVLEEIVGDIKDEYEFGRQHFRMINKAHFIVVGMMEIEEANEKLGLDIPKGNYETVAGFLLDRFGYIPETGERTVVGKWQYEVKKATERAIVEVEVLVMEE